MSDYCDAFTGIKINHVYFWINPVCMYYIFTTNIYHVQMVDKDTNISFVYFSSTTGFSIPSISGFTIWSSTKSNESEKSIELNAAHS